MKRVHFKGWSGVTDEGELALAMPGQFAERLTQALAPRGEVVREMLADLRKESGLPVAGLAALLGVPRITARRWLDGSRTPSGAAKRLIWVFYLSVHSPKLLADDSAWWLWTRPDFPLPTGEGEDNGLADGPTNGNPQCRPD